MIAAALALALLLVPTAAASLVDTRQFQGVSVWIKPLKFELSLAVHVATLGLFYAYLPSRIRGGWSGALATRILILIPLIELAYIALHASRAEASHYNLSTPLNAALYGAMGVGAVLLVLTPIAMGIAIIIAGNGPRSPVLKFSIGLGLLLGGLMGLITGMALGANGAHWVGNSHSDASGLPLFGWSRSVGDLRVAHFLGLHIIQALPMLGWLARAQRPSLGKPLVAIAGLAMVGVSAATLVQALRGGPLLP